MLGPVQSQEKGSDVGQATVKMHITEAKEKEANIDVETVLLFMEVRYYFFYCKRTCFLEYVVLQENRY